MSDDERRAFLMAGTRTAKLGVVRANGSPHVAPIWFVLDGGDMIFTTGRDTIKGKALRRDPRVVLVSTTTRRRMPSPSSKAPRLSATTSTKCSWGDELGGRYMGTERAEEVGRRNAEPNELLVRVTPTKINAQTGISD
jgi:PPOX class probable F420-dependent enzyme